METSIEINLLEEMKKHSMIEHFFARKPKKIDFQDVYEKLKGSGS